MPAFIRFWSRRAALLIGISLLSMVLSGVASADSTVPGGTFTDDDGNVHEGFIEALADSGITKGCNPPSNYRYCPGSTVTRGQMAAFLVRALGLPDASKSPFSDTRESVFTSDIDALAAAGITRGCNPPDNSAFCPDEPVTRGQMAAFLVRAFNVTGGAGADEFADDDESVFEDDIDRLAGAGITRGCDPPANSRFCPDEPVRRDQMASFLGRALGLDAANPPPPGPRTVISEDTMIENDRLVLRPGESIEFRNGARLMIGDGASVDWQGTRTTTWSDDGTVQNLERDVRIFGEGDIMFMEGSESSTLRYVEIDLQPSTELNHYPLHWHFAGDGSRGTLIEGVVVKNSTNRAFVPHASHGITFRDVIAKNIAGEAFWWNRPPTGDSTNRLNNSNDILYDRVLVDGVTNLPGDEHGHRLAAFELGAGTGNEVRDSIAMNVTPNVRKDCSGFHWPNGNIRQPRVWTATNLKVFSSTCHAIFFWQNTGPEHHVIDGVASPLGIKHGPYTASVEYRNVDVSSVIFNARSLSVTSGSVGQVIASWHKFEGTATFVDVSVGSLVVDNFRGENSQPGHYVFTRTGLTCADVSWREWVPNTTVTIDGVLCPPS